MREIITLQLGQQSNYLATHFWNTQESYFTYGSDQDSPVDHNVHFRPGVGADGSETFLPRTVIYDLKGGFGSMRKINALYEVDDAPDALWNGRPVVQRQQPIEASRYQQSLDAGLAAPDLAASDIRYWSDFSRVFFHPRSIVQLNEYELNSSIRPFEKWHMGEELFATLDKEHDILDRDMRPFIEEADQMQGIQVMAGIDDAWGGFAAKYLERMRDEYGKTPIWLWGVQEPTAGLPSDKRLLKLVNKARSLAEMNAQASLIVPVAVPREPLPARIQIDSSSPWHVSALFATAVESATLCTRLKPTAGINSSSLGTVADLLNVFGHQTIASLEMDLAEPPRPLLESGTGVQDLRGDLKRQLLSAPDSDIAAFEEAPAQESSQAEEPLAVDFSSPEELDLHHNRRGGRPKRHIFSQMSAYRGPGAAENSGNRSAAQGQRNSVPRYRPTVHKYHCDAAFPILDSFPRIYRRASGLAVDDSAPVKTALSTNSSVTEKVKGLRSTVVRYIGLEDRETISNDLAEIAESYREGWSSGSDDEDDDD